MAEIHINWFEVPASDLSRAADFYSSVLETSLGDMEGPGGPMKSFHANDMPVGAIVVSEQNSPSAEGALVYFGTEDIDGALRRVEANGGQVLVPRTSIGAYGFIAHFIDSEGNRVALHSHQ